MLVCVVPGECSQEVPRSTVGQVQINSSPTFDGLIQAMAAGGKFTAVIKA